MEPVLKLDGTPETEEVVYTIPRFRITTVFDVSQTEGEPLPELETPELMGNVENYEVFMGRFRMFLRFRFGLTRFRVEQKDITAVRIKRL